MGRKVPDSNLEITFDGSGNIQGQLYYGGDTTNTAHTPVTKANGDDVYLAPSVFEPILMAAHADVALKADGAVMEEALKGDNVPPEVGTWWDNMPTAFRAALPKGLDALFTWKFMPA